MTGLEIAFAVLLLIAIALLLRRMDRQAKEPPRENDTVAASRERWLQEIEFEERLGMRRPGERYYDELELYQEDI